MILSSKKGFLLKDYPAANELTSGLQSVLPQTKEERISYIIKNWLRKILHMIWTSLRMIYTFRL